MRGSRPRRERPEAGVWPGDRHLVFRTMDVDDACERAKDLLVSHRLRVDAGERPFEAAVHRANVGGLELLAFGYGASSQIVSAPLERFTCIHVPHRGQVRLEHQERTTVAAPGRAAVFSARGQLRMEWSAGLELLVVKVPQRLLEDRVSELIGRPLSHPLLFDVDLDVTHGAAAAAIGMSLHALRSTTERDVSGVLGRSVTDAVVSALLLGHRHNYLDSVYEPVPLSPPRLLRTVVDAVRADPAGAHTSRSLAVLAGVGERTLQLTFRSHTGMSPMAYLRRVRLELAHEQLLALRPDDGLTVLDVAVRCGFGHAGRFAAGYRQRFGEPPSATLRR